ncbi:enoyl-CoA hydratase/isomerase family protein [Solimonas sp. K1W22B-7]|uniref:enoyl-CoA hydratase/isomerase family protein n=1 Tax=Solimonas sp. K1W22B-7 TaxID=2303331 RepID=UPI0013C48EE1|nr:enoyl-CoA hydratase/isomerase family protein [Solimonas sp. K1W22B-7]
MPVLLTADLEGGVRLLTLNRPKSNAFNLELMQAVSAAVKDAERDAGVRALVLRGAGPVFSAGLDFEAMARAQAQGGQEFDEFYQSIGQVFIDLWTCPKPTVAAVTGHAIAAGFFAMLACDFRYVIEGSGRYGMNELAFGGGFSKIVIELGRYRLQRHMAPMIQGTELIGWQEGLRTGCFNASHSSEEALLAAATVQAKKIGAMPQAAYAHVKAQLVAPYVDLALADADENRRRSAAIFSDEESLRAMTLQMAQVLKVPARTS